MSLVQNSTYTYGERNGVGVWFMWLCTCAQACVWHAACIRLMRFEYITPINTHKYTSTKTHVSASASGELIGERALTMRA